MYLMQVQSLEAAAGLSRMHCVMGCGVGRCSGGSKHVIVIIRDGNAVGEAIMHGGFDILPFHACTPGRTFCSWRWGNWD